MTWSMLLAILAIVVFDHSIAVATKLPPRTFKSRKGVHRVGVEPTEKFIPTSDCKRSPRSVCGIECYAKEWCLAFNINHSTGECELFEEEVGGKLEKHNKASYLGKISADLRTCDGLSVVNGEDIPAGMKHNATVEIKCDSGYESELTTVKCEDGTFKSAVTDDPVTKVNCSKAELHSCDGVVVENGENIIKGTEHNATVEIKCDSGYESEHKTIKCDDGVFKSAVTDDSVTKVNCSKAELHSCDGLSVVNGEDIPTDTKHDTTVKIQCNSGYESELTTVKCDDSVFKTVPMDETVTEVICYEVPCGELLVANGTNVEAGTPHKGTVEIECNDDLTSYYLTATCIDGVFKPSRVLCENFPATDGATWKYQGQFMKVFDNPSENWDGGVQMCAAQKGIPATALSENMLEDMKHIIPYSIVNWIRVMIGLKQKESQATPNHGWQWTDGAFGAVIDIDTVETNDPLWFSGQPSDGGGILMTPLENNEENHAHLVRSFFHFGVNDAQSNPMHKVLCQIAYPWYEFELVDVGRRMKLPREKTISDATLEICTKSCIDSAFCRAVSYSAAFEKCHHHSTSPTDGSSSFIEDVDYNIYA